MESVAVTPVTKGFGLSLIIGTHCYPLDFYIIFLKLSYAYSVW